MATDPVTQTRQILAALAHGYAGNFTVRLWDGSSADIGTGAAPFTLVLKHPGALRIMFWPLGKVNLGESYIFDDFDVDGDIFAFINFLRHLVSQMDLRGPWDKLRLLRALLKLPGQKNADGRSDLPLTRADWYQELEVPSSKFQVPS